MKAAFVYGFALLAAVAQSKEIGLGVEQWLISNGASDIEVALNSGYKLETKETVSNGTVLANIPVSSLMSAGTAMQTPLKELIQHLSDSGEPLTGIVVLGLHLLYEKSIGEKSKYAEFIKTLPKHMDTPIMWDDEDLNFLEGSQSMVTNIKNRKMQLVNEYNAIYDFVCHDIEKKNEDGEVVTDLDSPNYGVFSKDVFTLEEFTWAMNIVWSYNTAINIADAEVNPQVPVLIPLLATAEQNESEHTDMEVNKDDLITLRATKDYEKGQNVQINWGPRGNGHLLLNQGYVKENNPFDYVTMGIRMSEQEAFYDIKKRLLTQRSINPDNGFIIRYDSERNSAVVPAQLMELLRIQLLKWTDFEHIEAVQEGKPVSLENEMLALQTLLAASEKVLSMYPTSYVEDQEKLLQHNNDESEVALSARALHSLKFQLSEKKILTHLRAWCHVKWNEIFVKGFPAGVATGAKN